MERARVTRILSNIKKEQGNIAAATDILCELQVETFGSMSRREKTEFILDQVALCIQKGDWTQATILGRKISTRYFARKAPKVSDGKDAEQDKNTNGGEDKAKRNETTGTVDAVSSMGQTLNGSVPDSEDDVTDLKLRFYELQIILAKHEGKYLDACKHWRQVLDTEAVENNPRQLKTVCRSVLVGLCTH